jgi:hypothetical protein
MVINDEMTVYHVMSRTALDGFPLGDIEKDFMPDLIKRFKHLFNSKHEKKPRPIKGLAGMYSLKRLSEFI